MLHASNRSRFNGLSNKLKEGGSVFKREFFHKLFLSTKNILHFTWNWKHISQNIPKEEVHIKSTHVHLKTEKMNSVV